MAAHNADEYHGPVRAEDTLERKKLDIELEIEANGGKVIFENDKPRQVIPADDAACFSHLPQNNFS